MVSKKAYTEVPAINGQFLEQYVIMRQSDGACLPDPGKGSFTHLEPQMPSQRWLPRFYTSPASAMRSLAQWCRGIHSLTPVRKIETLDGVDYVGGEFEVRPSLRQRVRSEFDIVAVHMYLGRRLRPTRLKAPRRKADGH